MWMMNKVGSIYHRGKTYFYKKSFRWKRHPLNIAAPPTDFKEVDGRLIQLSRKRSFGFYDFEIPKEEYFKFKGQGGISPLYAMGNKDKKILEHFISFKLLGLKEKDFYIDVASENSPFPRFFRKKLGVVGYSQDIRYREGVHGFKIGSSADSMPISDASVDCMSLQCAFEHFAEDIDIRFISEVKRVLRMNGKCCIVPLYLSSHYLNIVDPLLEHENIRTDQDATRIGETNLGGVFERIYSVDALKRILIPGIGLRYSIYRIKNHHEITRDAKSSVFRVQYALLVEKAG